MEGPREYQDLKDEEQALMDKEGHAKYMPKIMKGDIQEDTQLRWDVNVFNTPIDQAMRWFSMKKSWQSQ